MSIVLRDVVTVIHPGTVAGPYGSTELDWASASETLTAAAVQPLSSSEDVVNQERTLTRWRLFLPAAVPLEAVDRVRWDTLVLEVDGDVELWKRRGQPHHQEAVLRRVQGA